MFDRITYSQGNSKAMEYYKAFNHFENARNKVIDYEHKTHDRNSLEYKHLMDKFEFWDAKVPETSNAAAREEERLEQKENYKGLEKLGVSEPIQGHKLNIMA